MFIRQDDQVREIRLGEAEGGGVITNLLGFVVPSSWILLLSYTLAPPISFSARPRNCATLTFTQIHTHTHTQPAFSTYRSGTVAYWN